MPKVAQCLAQAEARIATEQDPKTRSRLLELRYELALCRGTSYTVILTLTDAHPKLHFDTQGYQTDPTWFTRGGMPNWTRYITHNTHSVTHTHTYAQTHAHTHARVLCFGRQSPDAARSTKSRTEMTCSWKHRKILRWTWIMKMMTQAFCTNRQTMMMWK